MPCYHLDTCYLISYLDNDPKSVEDKDFNRKARSTINRLLAQKSEVEISEIAVGEFLGVAIRDGYDDSMVMDFYHHLQQKHFKIRHVEDAELFSQLALEIRRADAWIESNDVLIIAHSMATANCSNLLTFDTNLIQSQGVTRIKNQHKPSFVIADDTR